MVERPVLGGSRPAGGRGRLKWPGTAPGGMFAALALPFRSSSDSALRPTGLSPAQGHFGSKIGWLRAERPALTVTLTLEKSVNRRVNVRISTLCQPCHRLTAARPHGRDRTKSNRGPTTHDKNEPNAFLQLLFNQSINGSPHLSPQEARKCAPASPPVLSPHTPHMSSPCHQPEQMTPTTNCRETPGGRRASCDDRSDRSPRRTTSPTRPPLPIFTPTSPTFPPYQNTGTLRHTLKTAWWPVG